MDRSSLGLHDRSSEQLASINLACSHARLPILRFAPGRPSFCQCSFACPKQHAALSPALVINRALLAERFYCGGVCFASAPRRVRRLDIRAKRCFERVVLSARLAAVCALRPLPGQILLAQAPRSFISTPTSLAALVHSRESCAFDTPVFPGDCFKSPRALAPVWLALVFHNAAARHRTRSGRHPIHGGSLY